MATAQLESEVQHGSAAKAAFSLERFCPSESMAPVFGDCVDGGGRCPEKENGPTPMGRLSRFRRPGRARLNSTGRG